MFKSVAGAKKCVNFNEAELLNVCFQSQTMSSFRNLLLHKYNIYLTAFEKNTLRKYVAYEKVILHVSS